MIFSSPARIERYDMADRAFLTDIPLSDTPTAFQVDADGLYISFGRRTSHFALDGSSETHLRNTNTDASSLEILGSYLYITASADVLSVDKQSGILLDSADYFYRMRGLDISPLAGKLFGRSVGVSPSDIVEVILNADGTLGNQDDSPYHGDYPSAEQIFVFPDETRAADNAGVVYNTTDLTYNGSLAGPFNDLAFDLDNPIVVRGSKLMAYDEDLLRTGQHTLANTPQSIFVHNGTIFSFYTDMSGTQVEHIPVSMLEPAQPGEPVDPNGLSYLPDDVVIGQDGIVYLLSRAHLSIFRWSLATHGYLQTIPLVEAPDFIAYSEATQRLYLARPSGEIVKLELPEAAATHLTPHWRMVHRHRY